jgi:hypothetical protein
MKVVVSLVLLLAVPVFAQSAPQLKQELKAKEAAAKKDPEALFAAGQWAAEKGLAAESKRIYQAVLKINPEHEGANLGLGNALIEGKWLAAKEAEALRKKALAVEFAAKGFVEVDDVWVEKERVDDAKRGIFHHDGELVTREEKIGLMAGMVRHPELGLLIEAKYAEKAQNQYYPIGNEGRWVDLKEADTFHSDVKRPWIVRSTNATLVSTASLAKITELKKLVDEACARIKPVFGDVVPSPRQRPVVVVAATESEYREIGSGMGDGSDAAGAFLTASADHVQIPYQGNVRASACYNHKDWGPYYVRHAAALAYAAGIAKDGGYDLPLWLLHGYASYTSRFSTDHDASWLGKQHVQKGGVRNLKGFFSGYAIDGGMDSKDVDYNVFQSGLLIAFAMLPEAEGGDAKVAEALQALHAMLTNRTNVEKNDKKRAAAFDKAVGKFAAALIEAEPKVGAFLQKLVAKG